MTDNEIIKALECCIAKENCEEFSCEKCPLERCSDCKEVMFQKAIDLINRQKAEIERLQKIIVGFIDEVGTWSNKYDVDISTIHKLPLLAKEDFNIKNKIKAEAIKEFADGLVTMFSNINESLNSEDIVENIKRFSSRLTEGREKCQNM